MKNIFSIALILLGILTFVLFTNGKFDAAKTLKAEADSFDNALARSKELIATRDALLQKYNAIPSENLARLNTMLPNSIDTVRLIIDINTVASRYNMSLGSISIGTPDQVSEDSTQIGPSGDAFGRLSLAFDVTASYDRFRAFLADLERSLRIIDITEISFSEDSEGAGLTTYKITFTTYWLK